MAVLRRTHAATAAFVVFRWDAIERVSAGLRGARQANRASGSSVGADLIPSQCVLTPRGLGLATATTSGISGSISRGFRATNDSLSGPPSEVRTAIGDITRAAHPLAIPPVEQRHHTSTRQQ